VIEIVCFTGRSGLTDYAVSLARSLVAITPCRLVTADSLEPRFAGLGFEVLRPFRRSRHVPLDILRFAWGVLRRRPDWLLLQGPLKWPLLDALVVRALRMSGRRCAVTVHDVLPHYPRPWSRATFGFYYRSFDRLVAHSQAARAGLAGLGVRAPVLVVPHGRYDLFCLTGIGRAEARQALGGIEPGRCLVLFFGHVDARKGVFELLALARQLQAEPRFQFLIAGAPALSAADETRFRRELAALGHLRLDEGRVPFEAVERYFSACDIVLLPYLEGTTSGVLKLALVFGRPVVATAVGDVPEQLPAGGGLCVPLGPQLVDGLAAALRTVAADPARFEAAVARADDAQQWPAIAARIQAFLNEGLDA
jgi:glycosyltransferase involved in cell wall biosynthesis